MVIKAPIMLFDEVLLDSGRTLLYMNRIMNRQEILYETQPQSSSRRKLYASVSVSKK